jgi:hypothetical protein
VGNICRLRGLRLTGKIYVLVTSVQYTFIGSRGSEEPRPREREAFMRISYISLAVGLWLLFSVVSLYVVYLVIKKAEPRARNLGKPDKWHGQTL